jgi:hypothetical protein
MHGDVSRRKMRVLVLFNGAERVRRVLDELDINVELFCVVDNVYALRKDMVTWLNGVNVTSHKLDYRSARLITLYLYLNAQYASEMLTFLFLKNFIFLVSCSLSKTNTHLPYN